MNQQAQQISNNDAGLPEYVPPVVRMMNESEVLSVFQVTAAGTATWWAM